MNRIICLYFLLLFGLQASAQTIYTKAFGDPKAKPIVFLHGGPGYNAVGFEATTAQQLADAGFYVIVYDRRGEGRSPDKKVLYNFQQTFDDLNDVTESYNLTKFSIIGHSFGGVVATLFAEKYPAKVNTVILVGAPVSLQATFKNIIARSTAIYESRKDSMNLNYMQMLRQMDTSSMMYASYSFAHAMQNGFYTPKNPTEEAKTIYTTFRKDTLVKYASQMTNEAPTGFWKNEHYTTLDLSADLKALKAKKMKIFALYGKDDGLYSEAQVMNTAAIIGKANLKYLDNCSHNVFMDQQTLFINAIKAWVKQTIHVKVGSIEVD